MIGGRRPGWGVNWGEPGEPPSDTIHADSDAAVAEILASARREGRPVPPVVLEGGDLARTLGITWPSVARGKPHTRVVADAGRVLINGSEHWFVAHLVARRSWWRGRLLAVVNGSFLGKWNVAPRAHPGDGRLNVLDTCPSLRVRWAARRRLPSGTHVPHPAISQRHITEARFELDPDLDIYTDGRKLARAADLIIKIEPAALEIWV